VFLSFKGLTVEHPVENRVAWTIPDHWRWNGTLRCRRDESDSEYRLSLSIDL